MENEADIDALVTWLYPVLLEAARRFVARMRLLEQADDLAQDAWVVLCQDGARVLRSWRSDGGASLAGYAVLVAERRWLNRGRSLKGGKGAIMVTDEVLAEEGGASPSPEESAIATELGARIQSRIAQMPGRGQLVFALVYRDGADPDRAAQVMGVSKQVIFNWMFKIRNAVREVLEEESHERTTGNVPG